MPVIPKKRKAQSIEETDNGEIADPFDESLLPDFTCPRALAAFIEASNGILGNEVTTDSLEKLTYTDRKYDAQKLRAINRFYFIISSHPSLSNLSALILDKEHESGTKRVPRFVILCRGLKTDAKKRIVNTCLMFVAQNFRKRTESSDLDWSAFWVDRSLFTKEHADACYQPSVTALYHRHLFKYLHDEGIMYSMSSDFNE